MKVFVVKTVIENGFDRILKRLFPFIGFSGKSVSHAGQNGVCVEITRHQVRQIRAHIDQHLGQGGAIRFPHMTIRFFQSSLMLAFRFAVEAFEPVCLKVQRLFQREPAVGSAA